MANWNLWTEEEIPGFPTGVQQFPSNGQVLALLQASFPNAVIEDFGDEILVYASLADLEEDLDPIAGATFEGE